MARPKGTKNIPTPEDMWEYFVEYRDSTKKIHRYKRELDRMGKIVKIPYETPLTMEGFENYLFANDIINDVSDYFRNKGGNYSDYSDICRAIKRIIRQDQIEGGMVGQYNPSITQRLNNLTDKSEVEHSGQITTITGMVIK